MGKTYKDSKYFEYKFKPHKLRFFKKSIKKHNNKKERAEQIELAENPGDFKRRNMNWRRHL